MLKKNSRINIDDIPDMPQVFKEMKHIFIHQSPHSLSFYSCYDKHWNKTPENTYRISDHWNFKFKNKRTKTSCMTNIKVKPHCWTLAQFKNGKYVVIMSLPKIYEWKFETKPYRKTTDNRTPQKIQEIIERWSQKEFSPKLHPVVREFLNEHGIDKPLYSHNNELYFITIDKSHNVILINDINGNRTATLSMRNKSFEHVKLIN